MNQNVDMSFRTKIVKKIIKGRLVAGKSDSRKMFAYAIKSSSPHSWKSAEAQGRQGNPDNLVGETSTTLSYRSAEMHICGCAAVCVSVHLCLRQRGESKDPGPVDGWTVHGIAVAGGIQRVCVFVCLCVGVCVVCKGVYASSCSGTAAQALNAGASNWEDWYAGTTAGQTECLS